MNKQLKRKLKKIQSRFIKTTVLYETVIDGKFYRVIEKTSILPWYKDRRAICFKEPAEHDRVYVYSMILNSKRARYQPVFVAPQKIIEAWHGLFKPKKALVLGTAGGTVPRFIALNFPEMQTVGVEYCRDIIEIAKEYFFLSQISDRFTLLEGDAFDYVINKKIPEKQDVVFVDIFDGVSIPCKVFSEEFLNSLYECTGKDSVIIFNLLTLGGDSAAEFAKGIKAKFAKKILVLNGNTVTLVLAKSENGEKLNAFSEKIHIFDSVIEL